MTIVNAERIHQDEEGDVVAGAELVVLDLIGTVASDERLVERAYAAAVRRTGIAERRELRGVLDYARMAAGQPRIEVFRAFARDENAARLATAEFERVYAAGVGGIRPIAGAVEAIRALRGEGIRVALASELAAPVQRSLIGALGWNGLVDLALSADDVDRGGAYPDRPLTALLRTGTRSVDGLVTAGDSVADMASGLNAGAGLVVGVLTGAHDRAELEGAGADVVIGSVAELPRLLGVRAG